VPGHFTTLWKSRSISTPSGQLAQEAAEYYYSARPECVNGSEPALLLQYSGSTGSLVASRLERNTEDWLWVGSEAAILVVVYNVPGAQVVGM
jgi:hypothetical protein